MALLLCIDSSTTHASVAVAKDAVLHGIKTSASQKDHASFLQPAIQSLLNELGLTLTQLNGVAITTGPGSYTGLRVGMATAKGLSFALNIPLIGIPTTLVMSVAAREQLTDETGFVLCPMIDARRMEVFTAVYSSELELLSPITPKVLDSASFTEELTSRLVYFFGDGSVKWQNICTSANARFISTHWSSKNAVAIAERYYNAGNFLSLAYSAPEYGKGFHIGKQ
ncbi:tRNA (adenosine(37)-N6)-threonylcarbamoyltransferase complex dimerization subunit type 1 TsaB [Lacibacter luteus]|uniref:tRNA (Adenosine(37)-N6)-threonylcarbamoyltransferase complex dimerization subunit type 1 TsaB n=1 Tax=Lacibacter luteus TaxID=2508719 RepID=A0A4Q1CHW1_9BACT|nr:tRNA (adenosine(37)-N6)-threonylcarbamoyltransferase complex dimerization subunit type 1 TsaB [Lacibacter luteus]RXK59811.1 tRNA (adenosine(37)-N6)-threonylcarbamoyltransferase complex dimerization subunit type 1 TsaB [Lacibacter luteus]